MASSSNPKKRIKQIVSSGRCIDERGHLEGWFASLNESESVESIDRYLRELSKKIINTPKFVRLDWLKSEQRLEVIELLEQQGLERWTDWKRISRLGESVLHESKSKGRKAEI